MEEFWEKKFREKQEMWGFRPTISAIKAAEFFSGNRVKNVLIPGIGYGRNAQVFINKGLNVTGIEISETAIDLAVKNFGESLKIYHGSVKDMPFDSERYDGIFCHALIHLLDEAERAEFIKNCYDQLADNGYMVFTLISKAAPTYGQGERLSDDRYEQFGGVQMYFYDIMSIEMEFGKYGLIEIQPILENYPFYLITCNKILY